jgi:hypothetical protein
LKIIETLPSVTEPVKTKKEPGSYQKYGVELREQSPPFWQ